MKFTRFLALFLIVVLGLGFLAGCDLLFQFEEYNPDDGYDNPAGDYVEPDYDFVVSCTKETTTITLGNIGYYGDVAKLVYIKPYEYLKGETDTGIVEDYSAVATSLGNYDCGTEATFTINRYDEEGYDTMYCKFYVVATDGEILDGPKYATEITPIYDHEEVIQAKGIKGVFGEWGMLDDIVELGCEHTEINMVVTGMIVPLETVNPATGDPIEIEYDTSHLETDGYIVGPEGGPQYVEAFEHNGKTYYFRKQRLGIWDNLDFYDEVISAYTRAGLKMTVILLMSYDSNQYNQPYYLTYDAAKYSTATYFAVNTSNAYGAEYWAAFTEFLARRYSHEETYEDAVYGTVESWVLGNEIDQANAWNIIVDTNKYDKLTVEKYAGEYERMMRITNQSFKKVYERNVVLVPFTHHWAGSSGVNDYSPKEIFDYMCTKTRKEGNYNWGLAAHPYGATLNIPTFWTWDIRYGNVTGAINTTRITWSNLEILQLYLEQEFKMCNGKVRDVYVTEGGVSSSPDGSVFSTSEDKYNQAAGVAYAYYKCSQLPCIKAFNYYKFVDTPIEGAYFGLMTEGGSAKKPSYEVYKFIDTQYSWDVTDLYLNYINWVDQSGAHGRSVNPSTTWQDVMRLRATNFDWNLRWNEDRAIVRETDEVPSL